MDVAKILDDLRRERDQLEEAILSLERLAAGRGPRRGRPPAWMSEARMSETKKRGRPIGSKNKPKNTEPPVSQNTGQQVMTAGSAAA